MISLTKWLPSIVEAFTFYGGGGKGGGGGGSTQTTTVTPWAGAQPYITDYLSKAKKLSSNPYQFYNGDVTAGFSPEQEMGFGLGTQRALAGSPTLNSANTNITDTLNGNYLSPDSNPWLKANVDQALGDVQSRINSQFNNSNFGSSAHQETLARNLGSTAANMYGANYTGERNNQLQAAGMAPNLAASDYLDSQALQGIGAQRQGLSQQYLNNAKSQFDLAAQWPYQQLDRYGSAVGLGMGAGKTETSPNPYQSNPTANAIGGALTGYGLGGALGSSALGQSWITSNPGLTYSMFGPMGAVGGAILGGLL